MVEQRVSLDSRLATAPHSGAQGLLELKAYGQWERLKHWIFQSFNVVSICTISSSYTTFCVNQHLILITSPILWIDVQHEIFETHNIPHTTISWSLTKILPEEYNTCLPHPSLI
jgi:hypothetical protein